MDKNIFDITPQPDPRPEGKCCCGDADNLTISWIHIHKIIDECMEKSDRSVSSLLGLLTKLRTGQVLWRRLLLSYQPFQVPFL